MDSEPTAWRPVATADGSWTLAHPVHGETCHSTAGAWLEARERYAQPCRLRELGLAAEGTVRLLDVGTGIGLNLAAALAELEGTGARLEAVTLEVDPDVIRAGLALPPAPAAERWHAPVREALARALEAPGEPVELAAAGSLRLVLGDGRATLPVLREAAFDAVFLDPFSRSVAGELWEQGFLAEVARRMGPQAILSTYSSAFAVRLALLRAGLRVGLGPRVGRKATGTLASREGALPPLEGRTARRLAARGRGGPENRTQPGEKRAPFA
jgi:tRNA U34 5-methylaminomethyl-2-thiouridine-forming methyltransferase MnmC